MLSPENALEVLKFGPTPYTCYCPVCRCVLVAENKQELLSGLAVSAYYIHPHGIHTDTDIEALRYGIQ